MNDLPLSPKQLDAIRGSTARVNLYSGAIRSGKTVASLLRFLIYTASAPRGGQLVVVGRTRDSVARNVFAPLTDPSLFGLLAAHVNYTAGAPTGRVLDRTVYVLGASDSKAEKVLRGLTCCGAYVDELTVVAEDFFTQLLGRMSVPGAQLFATTNPDNPAHWVKRRYLDRLAQLPDWRSFTFRLDDNPALTQSYKDSIRREYTGLWYRRFVLGEWVAAEGAVFSGWNPARHVVSADALPTMTRVLAAGIDHGMTNPSAAILLGIGANGALYAINEWWLDPTHGVERPTVGQQSAMIRGWLNTQPTRPEFVIVDPAAASLRVQLHHDGVTTQAADNDVSYGIALLASLLGSGRMFISDRCPNLIREIPAYSWSTQATEKGDDKPIKVADHACDAWRYSVVTTENLWRPLLALAA
ncbi:PBSX family phage terminase large subunit [Actinocrispum wychmicini]|uniref:PBSX family phage terminase large subunit n=1 Tax=Actinocrispum wychmicini TaxID=1213861 RepID=A0A4R2KCZ8_9PSEU|nr:PBSX family phage terminase large subunit [Actinocrispum wychmicini]TCO64375.1 PBSX family phage terminase large subunit [Actinocrispum wychmicini]